MLSEKENGFLRDDALFKMCKMEITCFFVRAVPPSLDHNQARASQETELSRFSSYGQSGSWRNDTSVLNEEDAEV